MIGLGKYDLDMGEVVIIQICDKFIESGFVWNGNIRESILVIHGDLFRSIDL